MDGFNTENNVIVFGGTNRVDILDPAILRPGRFDRQISVDLPDINGRKEIAKIYLRKIIITGEIDHFAQRIASLTPGLSGAEIANICNESALIAARNSHETVLFGDMEAAIDREIGGIEKKNKILTENERKTIAYHESGHATVSWLLEHSDSLLKVTIVPRGQSALGYAQYLPKELSLYTKEQLIDKLCSMLGGRAAEEILLGEITTGSSNDIEKANELVRSMVTMYGMSKEIGHIDNTRDEYGKGCLR